MAKPKRDPLREDRIHNEALVDTYGLEEQALGWYYYLENKMRFPLSKPGASLPRWSHHSEREKRLRSGAWRPKMPVPATCSCSFAGRAGIWRFPWLN